MTKEKKTASQPEGTGEVASKRKAYRKERESALRELDAKLDEVRKKALEITSGTRKDLDEAMRALGERRDRFATRLSGLREASGDAWEDLKKGVDNSWDELEDAFGDLRKGVSSALGRFR